MLAGRMQELEIRGQDDKAGIAESFVAVYGVIKIRWEALSVVKSKIVCKLPLGLQL